VKPDVDLVLRRIAEALLGETAPRVSDDYASRNTSLAAMLLLSAAEEWDRAAARRTEENDALRTLFREAAPCVEDPALATRLADAAARRDGSLRVADLEAANHALRALLVELHAHVEELATPAAREIEAAIWAELRRSTERRALSIAPF
jgi:hypothetical protein